MNRIPLYLMALILAIANSPTNVFQICKWNVGTLEIEPWRAKLTKAIAGRARTLVSTLRSWFGASGGLPAAVAIAILIVLIAAPHVRAEAGTVLAIAPMGLKSARQRVADLKAEIREKKTARAALGEKAITDKREMTEEERTAFTAAKAPIEALDNQLVMAEEILQAAVEANEAERELEPVDDPDAKVALAGASGAKLEVGTSAEEKAMKAPGFIGRCLQAVHRSATRSAISGDEKLLKMLAGPSGMSTDVPSDGGFVVAPNWSNSIIQRAYDVGEVLGLVDRMTITTGNGMNLPAVDETSRADGSRYGGIVSGWLGQGNTLSLGKPKIRLMELKLRKVGAFVYGTDELIADAPALQTWIEKYLPQELSFRTEDAIVNGDGLNKPVGMLNSGAAVTVPRNTAARVLYEDASAMWSRMWAPLRKTAVWMVDQSVEQQLETFQVAIGTAGVLAPIYKPAGIAVGPDGTQGYSPATLYGRPILTTEYGANLGTVGDIVLWAPGEYQLIDKGTIEQMVSLHVAFLTDEAVWRFMYRVDGQLKWNAPLTPKSGGSTLSSVVTLT